MVILFNNLNIFRSNIPVRIWGLFAGILLGAVVLCFIISFYTGLHSAVITVNKDIYNPTEAEILINEYLDKITALETDISALQTDIQSINANYNTLLQDFDQLELDYETSIQENAKLTSELKKQTGQNVNLNAVNENLQLRNIELEEQLNDMSTKIEDLNAQVESLNTRLSGSQKDNSTLKRRLKEIQNLLGQLVGSGS